MKITRQKHAKKHLGFFRNHFGVREPYQILLDGTFCQAALRGLRPAGLSARERKHQATEGGARPPEEEEEEKEGGRPQSTQLLEEKEESTRRKVPCLRKEEEEEKNPEQIDPESAF
uniref:UTP23 small subunit processome component n=1 Tax=Cricetulus griseus TaxID=10029 RepID=A0A8C2LG73_CRIGR